MSKKLKSSAQTVQDALVAAGVEAQVAELPASTRSALDAARALDCEVAQIAKSLILRTETGEAILVIASGANRISESRIGLAAGCRVEMASARFVREATGFAIGGVPPVGHTTTLRTFIDRELLELDTLWAAAGTPNAVFELTPAALSEITRGTIVDVHE